MKNILKNVNRPAKIALISGWVAIAVVVATSTVLYIGAGRVFDYFSAVELSEKLLTSSRPLSVVVFAVSTGLEYGLKKRNGSTD